jgi:hypothetical protein
MTLRPRSNEQVPHDVIAAPKQDYGNSQMEYLSIRVVPATATFHGCNRRAFMLAYLQDVFVEFRAACRHRGGKHRRRPHMPTFNHEIQQSDRGED